MLTSFIGRSTEKLTDPQWTKQCSKVSRKTTWKITLASLFAGFAGLASANLSDQWYVGAGATSSQLLPRTQAANVTRTEETGQGATVFVGRDFDERSSGQIQLYSLGEAIFSDGSSASYTAADASLIFRFYDTRDKQRNARFGLSVYGRFGLGAIERDSINSLRTDDTSPVYFGAGGGLEAYLTNTFAVRSELLFHERDAVSASISLVARFGARKGNHDGPASAIPGPSATRAPSEIQQQPPASTQAKQQSATKQIPGAQVSGTGTQENLTNGNNRRFAETRAHSENTVNSPSASTSYDVPDVELMVDPHEFIDPAINPRSPQLARPAEVPSPVPFQGITADADNDGVTDDNDQCQRSNPGYPVGPSGCSLFAQLAGAIQFVENSALPLPRTEQALQQLAEKMIQFPTTRIELIAHTHNAGNPQAESALTRQRLRAIGIYLVQRGISQDRLLLRSFAAKRPAFDNSSTQGRRANNRIEIVEKP